MWCAQSLIIVSKAANAENFIEIRLHFLSDTHPHSKYRITHPLLMWHDGLLPGPDVYPALFCWSCIVGHPVSICYLNKQKQLKHEDISAARCPVHLMRCRRAVTVKVILVSTVSGCSLLESHSTPRACIEMQRRGGGVASRRRVVCLRRGPPSSATLPLGGQADR